MPSRKEVDSELYYKAPAVFVPRASSGIGRKTKAGLLYPTAMKQRKHLLKCGVSPSSVFYFHSESRAVRSTTRILNNRHAPPFPPSPSPVCHQPRSPHRKRSSSASCDHQASSENPALKENVEAVTEVDEFLKRSQEMTGNSRGSGSGSGSPGQDKGTRKQSPREGADKWSKSKWSKGR